jgi:23S rRNA (uridine2552-2'-O)-methyltransferase
MTKKRKASSQRWLHRQLNDEFTIKAKLDGYRSRAVYKLQELNLKDKLFRPGMVVVDLGAAPGGWSQLAIKLVKPNLGRVYSLDIDYIAAINGVTIIQGDFGEQLTLDLLLSKLENKCVDVVICDLAPNFSGIKGIDQPSVLYLVELALDFTKQVLKAGGSFVVKIFHGEGFEEFLAQTRQAFATVKIRKPKASRKGSKEVYLVGLGFNKKGEIP